MQPRIGVPQNIQRRHLEKFARNLGRFTALWADLLAN
jgi:hypothetical protein